MTNSSPLRRPTVSPSRRRRRAVPQTVFRSLSPAAWPKVSLTCLNPSTSRNSAATGPWSRRRRRAYARPGRAREGDSAARSSRRAAPDDGARPVRITDRDRRASTLDASCFAASARRRAAGASQNRKSDAVRDDIGWLHLIAASVALASDRCFAVVGSCAAPRKSTADRPPIALLSTASRLMQLRSA